MTLEDFCKTCRYKDFAGCYLCKLAELNKDGTPYGYEKQPLTQKG